MTRPRSALIDIEATPYYHVIARCVRRWFLLAGNEKGDEINHRKPWFLQRLKLLAEVFAIDIPAYAVMSNHYHLVLHVNKARADSWSKEEVIERWTRLYQGPELVRRFKQGEVLSEAELQVVDATASTWRDRLADISWFMSSLNYYIALHANKEDGCKGRFWEGRFISQALLDVTALLSCMAYVDLNPVRAGIADNLEESDFTSIQDRIRRIQQDIPEGKPALMNFREVEKDDQIEAALPFGLKDYLELVDWTGRAQRPDKKGFIRINQPRLLQRLGLNDVQWRQLAQEVQKEAATKLSGLNKLAVIERRKTRQAAA